MTLLRNESVRTEQAAPADLLNDKMRSLIEGNPDSVHYLETQISILEGQKKEVPTAMQASLEYAKSFWSKNQQTNKDEELLEPQEEDGPPQELTAKNVLGEPIKPSGNILGIAKETVNKIASRLRDNNEDREAEEVTRLTKTDIPSVVSEKGLIRYIEGNRLSIKPIRIGEKDFYEVKTRGGEVLFHAPADNVKLEIMRDTIVGLETDDLEIGKLYEIAAKVQTALRRMGLPADQVPVDPGQIAEKIIALSEKFEAIQESRSKIEMQNTFQGLLAAVQDVYEKGDESMKKYDKKTQRLIGEIMETINIRAIQNMQIDENTVAVAENIKLIAIEMAQARMAQSGWKKLGNYIQGAVSGTSKLLTGNEALLPGTLDVAHQVGQKGIDLGAKALGKVKHGVTHVEWDWKTKGKGSSSNDEGSEVIDAEE